MLRLSASAQWRSSNTTSPGWPAVTSRTSSTAARMRSSAGRASSWITGSRAGAARRSPTWRTASRKSSIGRPTVPGSACPASTTVPLRQVADQLLHQAGLADARLAGHQGDGGGGGGAEEPAESAELGGSTDHHRRQSRTSHEHAGIVRVRRRGVSRCESGAGTRRRACAPRRVRRRSPGLVAEGPLAFGDEGPGHLVAGEHGAIVRLYAVGHIGRPAHLRGVWGT